MAIDDGPRMLEVLDGERARPPQLPLRLTSFVGRQHELVSLLQRLDVSRLLSVVGPGGIGKTRLALELARKCVGGHQDGLVFVDLAPLATPELVVQAVAGALGLRVELDRNPQGAILRFLEARDLLLVLDNCEHLVEAALNWRISCWSAALV
jgi:non-specific serine/threonine protein kinase